VNKPAAIAAELVTLLNAGSFTLPFTAIRSYAPLFTREELETLRVCVAPRTRERVPIDREDSHDDVNIDVWVMKGITGEIPVTEADPVADFAEEILNWSERKNPATVTGFSWVRSEQLFMIPEHLQTKGVFTSIITITYRGRTS
jgi:hypothetical protein